MVHVTDRLALDSRRREEQSEARQRDIYTHRYLGDGGDFTAFSVDRYRNGRTGREGNEGRNIVNNQKQNNQLLDEKRKKKKSVPHLKSHIRHRALRHPPTNQPDRLDKHTYTTMIWHAWNLGSQTLSRKQMASLFVPRHVTVLSLVCPKTCPKTMGRRDGESFDR